MTDVELVIKIPENTYRMFKNLNQIIGILSFEKDTLALIKAVKNGTPLPKGHGDLIDISPYKGKVICSHLYSGVKKLAEVDSIEPIIAADRPGNKEADSIRPKAGTPREDYEPEYDCEDWIP